MAFRAKLFKDLGIVTLALSVLAIGGVLLLIPQGIRQSNQIFINMRDENIAAKKFDEAAVDSEFIKTPAEVESAILASEIQLIGCVVAFGSPIIIVCLLLSWRNAAGLLAEKRHREIMSALRSIYQSTVRVVPSAPETGQEQMPPQKLTRLGTLTSQREN